MALAGSSREAALEAARGRCHSPGRRAGRRPGHDLRPRRGGRAARLPARQRGPRSRQGGRRADLALRSERMWEVLEEDLAAISIGAAAMGTGGGGNAYLGMIHVREQLRSGLRVRVVSLDEVPDDWFLVAGGFMGAPVVTYEKLRQGREEIRAIEALQEQPRAPDRCHRPVRDRRRELDDGAGHRRRAGHPGRGRGRDGPRLPRAPDGHLPHVRRAGRGRPPWPTTRAMSSSCTGCATPAASSGSRGQSRSRWAARRASRWLR